MANNQLFLLEKPSHALWAGYLSSDWDWVSWVCDLSSSHSLLNVSLTHLVHLATDYCKATATAPWRDLQLLCYLSKPLAIITSHNALPNSYLENISFWTSLVQRKLPNCHHALFPICGLRAQFAKRQRDSLKVLYCSVPHLSLTSTLWK